MMGGPRRTSKGAAKLKRSIVLYVLQVGSACSRAELAAALSDTPAILALRRLQTQRVITLTEPREQLVDRRLAAMRSQ
jgi:hypothetical protein